MGLKADLRSPEIHTELELCFALHFQNGCTRKFVSRSKIQRDRTGPLLSLKFEIFRNSPGVAFGLF